MAHRVSPQAEADLDDIWVYVAKEGGSMPATCLKGTSPVDSPVQSEAAMVVARTRFRGGVAVDVQVRERTHLALRRYRTLAGYPAKPMAEAGFEPTPSKLNGSRILAQ
jgi:plasmid stabilization system protein ParE